MVIRGFAKEPWDCFSDDTVLFSLSVYVIHHVVHIWPLRMLEWWAKDTHTWIMGMLNPAILFVSAILFILFFYGVLILWERKKVYSFEGLLRWYSES
jgi:hypothetical protein